MTEPRNRRLAPEREWRLPVTPPVGVGVVFPSCDDHSDVLAVPVRTGEGLRIAGEARLCFDCGPDGSVYHPDGEYTFLELRAIADRLPFVTGYDPDDLTPAVFADFEREMRRRLGMEEER